MKIENYKLIGVLVVIFFVAIVSLGVIELRALDNTVKGYQLLGYCSLLGLFIGLSTATFFQIKKPQKEAVATMRRWIVCLLVPIFILPIIGSSTNRMFAAETNFIEVELIEEKPIKSGGIFLSSDGKIQPDAYHLFVFLNGEIQRFTMKKPCCLDKERGETITIKLAEGILGYDFIEE